MITQLAIALTGLIAIWLTQQSNEKLHKYASIFGLLGQPFWFYSSYQAEQWGIFVLCIGYTFVWFIGFRRHWL